MHTLQTLKKLPIGDLAQWYSTSLACPRTQVQFSAPGNGWGKCSLLRNKHSTKKEDLALRCTNIKSVVPQHDERALENMHSWTPVVRGKQVPRLCSSSDIQQHLNPHVLLRCLFLSDQPQFLNCLFFSKYHLYFRFLNYYSQYSNSPFLCNSSKFTDSRIYSSSQTELPQVPGDPCSAPVL